jgi:NADH-quinone oxidoreductase subunit G
MATIFVDNVPYEVKDGQSLLTACLSLGFNVPYFCWHPAMHSVGSCRLCAVKNFRDEKDTRGHIVMSCMTPAENGTRISINDPEAREFRAAVIEWLMINHPHDCPVCDEGGECHLQDMTVMTGHTYRRTRSRKRTFRNQDLGPFIHHEMNRCIQCYRCVRFYRDYAGGRDLDVFGIHDRLYFGRFESGVLESEFAGNLVEVCPTGVFTDRTLRRHFTRKWDLQTAPSVCIHCGVGCNTIPGERYGTLRRILNRYNGEVNGYFLCDRGRFGYEFVNGPTRIRKPLIRRSEDHDTVSLEVVSSDEALQHFKRVLSESSHVIGIGSPRASLESNFALASFVGRENFFSGMSDKDQVLVSCMVEILRNGSVPSPSLRDVERSDALLVLGEDVSNTSPRLALALRQALHVKPFAAAADLHIPRWNAGAVQQVVQDAKGPLFIAAPYSTRLDEVSKAALRLAPDDIARLGFAIAANLDPAATKLPTLPSYLIAASTVITAELKAAERPLVVSGTGCGTTAVMEAAANIARALCRIGKHAGLSLSAGECNSVGAALLGGRTLGAAFDEVKSGEADTVIVLENNLYRRAEAHFVEELLRQAKNVIVLDHTMHEFASRASVALPVGTFAESEGTLVNNEGRAQRFFRVFPAGKDVCTAWQWIRGMTTESGDSRIAPPGTPDEIASAMATAIPLLRPVREITPPADFRVVGQKIPRQPQRYSGRTALSANLSVHEPGPPSDAESALAFSMEGYKEQPPPSLIPRFWAPGWNSVQSLNKFQSEIGGSLRGGDPGFRLIEPAESPATNYFSQIPSAFERRDNEWLFVSLHHVFGSEELSALSQSIQERSPDPYVGLSKIDMEDLALSEGDDVLVSVGSSVFRVKSRMAPGLPRGLAGLPAGLPGIESFALPAWGTVSATLDRKQDQTQ